MELGTFKFWPVKNEWMTTHLASCHRRRKRPSLPIATANSKERNERPTRTDVEDLRMGMQNHSTVWLPFAYLFSLSFNLLNNVQNTCKSPLFHG